MMQTEYIPLKDSLDKKTISATIAGLLMATALSFPSEPIKTAYGSTDRTNPLRPDQYKDSYVATLAGNTYVVTQNNFRLGTVNTPDIDKDGIKDIVLTSRNGNELFFLGIPYDTISLEKNKNKPKASPLEANILKRN